MACVDMVDHGGKLGPRFSPSVLEALAKGSRMAQTENRRTGVVVEIGKAIPPNDEHRAGRADHQGSAGLQGRRPILKPP